MVEPHVGSLLSCSTCSRLRCSFLGAITHCTPDQLGTTGNPAVSDITPTRSIATFCTLSSLVKESRASLTRGWAEVRRGKDSDFENPVNALQRPTWKNPCGSPFRGLDRSERQVIRRNRRADHRLRRAEMARTGLIHSQFNLALSSRVHVDRSPRPIPLEASPCMTQGAPAREHPGVVERVGGGHGGQRLF